MINVADKILLVNANPEFLIDLDSKFHDAISDRDMVLSDIVDETTVILIKRRIMTGGRGNHELVRFIYKDDKLEETDEIIPIPYGNVLQLITIVDYLKSKYTNEQIMFIDSYDMNVETIAHLNYHLVGLLKHREDEENE